MSIPLKVMNKSCSVWSIPNGGPQLAKPKPMPNPKRFAGINRDHIVDQRFSRAFEIED